MIPYVDFQFVLPRTVGLPMWWWFGWLGLGSVSVYLLFTWWYSRQAVREDELAAHEEAKKQQGGSAQRPDQGTSGRQGPTGAA